MKILICVDRLTGGGAQRVASLWIQGFVKEGHDVSVVLSNIRAPITYPIPEIVPIYNVDFDIKNRYVRHLCKVLLKKRKLKKVLQDICPDVVIAVGVLWSPAIFKVCKDRQYKVIITDHFVYERPPEVGQISESIQRIRFHLNKSFDAVTVLTQADKDYIGNKLDNVFVLPNPLSFEPIKTNYVEREKSILAVGRFNNPIGKGFDILIQAFGKLVNDFSDWKLEIMGEGNMAERQHLLSLAKSGGIINNFELIPFQADPIPAYRKAGIFCLSSRYEGFGMVLIEAMSQGCACVACDYKGRQREIIPNDDFGLICTAGDVEALTQSLARMMSDDNYRHHVEMNAPIRSAVFSLDNIMQKWNEIFLRAKIALPDENVSSR